MQFTAKTIALEGVRARPVFVQCQLSRGMHSFNIVGLPGKAVREAKERILAAFYSHSLSLPPMRITFNLSPADIPKSGSHYDLPMALALLVNMELLPRAEIENSVALGELSLDGKIEAVSGVLAAALLADKEAASLICPRENASEAMLVENLELLAPEKLIELIKHFRGRALSLPKISTEQSDVKKHRDISEVKGLEPQKRALEIAASGRHHLFMVGPPGAGKSLLASTLPSIMPPLLPNEIMETTLVHSAAGLLKDGSHILERPYFDPHHSASAAAIVGGGRDALPGEISLAHNGVLFLDELPEFKRDVLESLRQPLETSQVLISRANAHVSYPAKFLLVAAANPCPCGWMYDNAKSCNRTPDCGERYMERISGPLLDRMSLRTAVQGLSLDEIKSSVPRETSAQVKARVSAARKRQYTRNGEGVCNEDLSAAALDYYLGKATEPSQKLCHRAMETLSLSTRGYYRLIKTALTICDLRQGDFINEEDVAEAVLYRLIEQDPSAFDARKSLKRLDLPH